MKPSDAVVGDRNGKSEEERREVQPTPEGTGPLLQRDYVIVVEGSACSPEQAVAMLRRGFPRFSPATLAHFMRPPGETGLLEVGHTMRVHVRGIGNAGVVVSHVDGCSFTLRTLRGHPEAGRITFGASRDAAGRLVCRIRSRARIDTLHRYIGYRLLGKRAQTNAWMAFLRRTATACGGKVLGDVLVSTDEVTDSPADRGHVEAPTHGRFSEAAAEASPAS